MKHLLLAREILRYAARALPAVLADSEVARAREFAVAAHGNQLYGNRPYVAHLDTVLGLAAHFGLSRELQVAAAVHDTREDTLTTDAQLRAEFGAAVADLVDSVSGFGANRKARTADTLVKLREHPEHVALKLMDRLGNVAAATDEELPQLVAMYQREAPLYDEMFFDAHPEAAQLLRELLS